MLAPDISAIAANTTMPVMILFFKMRILHILYPDKPELKIEK